MRKVNSERGLCLMYLPAVALMIVFVIYRLSQGVHVSRTNWDG